MGRPLQGRIKEIPGGWRVELPAARGAARRTHRDFRERRAAERWRDLAVASLNDGAALPEPREQALLRKPRQSAVPTGTSFRVLGARWQKEYYQQLHRGEVDRESTVAGHIHRIASYMEEHGLVIETMTRDHVLAFSLTLQGAPDVAVADVPAGLDPEELVSMDEALTLPGMPSKATLKRRASDGTLPRHREGERVLYRVADLYDAAVGAGTTLKRGPRRQHGVAQAVIADILRVLEAVFAYASDYGVDVPQDRASLVAPISNAPDPEQRSRPNLRLPVCRQLASGMHVVHQLALWLLRVLGLRISEAFGILVGDVHDHGPGQPGLLAVRNQGGKPMKRRNRRTGEVHIAQHVSNDLKTFASYRILVVPPALMDLIRLVIRVFHTDESGEPRPDARLLPGLQRQDESGQAAFRAVLREQSAALGLVVREGAEEAVLVRPHDMRYAVISQLAWDKVQEIFRKRFAGHAAGDDVHAGYILDDPRLEPAHEVAAVLQRAIEKELPGGLLVPTLVRCTTGNQRALTADAARIDTALIEAGLLLLPGDPDDPLLTTEQGASLLDVTEQTYRAYLREAVVPSVVWQQRVRGVERRARRSDVVALADRLRNQVTLNALADELGRGYATVYQYVRAQGLDLTRLGERRYTVPPATAESVLAHYRRQAELEQRSMRLRAAAAELATNVTAVMAYLADGRLDEDDRAHDGSRMVTRASVAALKHRSPRRQSATRKAKPRPDLMSWQEAATTTGLEDAALKALVADGRLVLTMHNRSRHLTRTSVLGWLLQHSPERLRIVGAD